MKKLPLAVKNKILKKQKDRYNLLLIHKNPSADSLKIIGPRDLGIYLKDDKLYCKINNKEEIEIIPFKNTIDTTAGIDPDVFFRLKSSLEENVAPNVADKMELVEDTYRMGYSLPEYKFNIQLSPYDHCLSEEEAEEQLLSYDTPLTPYNKKKYFEGEAKFINFYIKIYSHYSTFFCFHNFLGDPEEFYKFESQDELEKICTESLREKRFIDLYVEEIGLLISATYDLEVLLFTNDLSVVKNLQEKNFMEGLHLIY